MNFNLDWAPFRKYLIMYIQIFPKPKIPKIWNSIGAGGVDQVVEHLSGKCKALNSIPITEKNKRIYN
jgi:hypothetical protein